jgi:transcription antitermination factor NusG
MDNALKWYAVYTRSRFEKKTARWLTEQGIEAYVPLQRVVRQWSDRRKLVLEPAIPSYVFVHIDHRLYYKVLETPGVVRYVFFDGKPAVVRDEEIDTLKRVMDSDLEVECLPDDLQPGMQVRIIQGPLTGIEGEFVEYMGKQKVALRIEAIRQVMMVTLAPQMLEPLK